MELEMYHYCFAIALVACIAITVKSQAKTSGSADQAMTPTFKKFQMTYLAVYYAAMFADWLQGPYVYALYSSYNYSKYDISVLFVAGFGSSMVFGTFIGSLADQYGRKLFVLVYVAMYIASCCTKHYDNYHVLMLGRLLGGIATSLLFSVFDSWMVAEHNVRGFDPSLMSDTFSKAFFGNSVVAILAGLVGEAASEYSPLHKSTLPTEPYFGGYVAPFDASSLFLVICGVLVVMYWSENYGARDGALAASSGLSSDSIRNAITAIKADKKIWLIGAISSLFEGSMYTFVFLWTPVMRDADRNDLPFGIIFAAFMVSCMTGSSLYKVLSVNKVPPQTASKYTFLVASVALLIPVLVTSATVVLCAFMLFEACVGIYWPAFGTMKGMYVPENNRSAIYNVFRVPLNAIVLGVLLSEIASITAFAMCAAMLFTAFYLTTLLTEEIKKTAPVSSEEMTEQDDPLLATEGKDTV